MADEENKDPALDGEDGEDNEQRAEDAQYPNIDAKMRENVKAIFTTFDKENVGTIDMQSLAMLLRWCSFNPTEQELDEYRNRYDPGSKNAIHCDNVM